MTRRYVIRTRLASQRYSDLATRGRATRPTRSAGITVCLASKCSFFLVRRFSLASGGLVPRVIPAGRIEVDFVTLASQSRSEGQRPAERHCRARARCYRYLPEHGTHPPQPVYSPDGSSASRKSREFAIYRERGHFERRSRWLGVTKAKALFARWMMALGRHFEGTRPSFHSSSGTRDWVALTQIP